MGAEKGKAKRYTWVDRNPLFQSYSDRSLRLIAAGQGGKDARAARAELEHRGKS